MNINFEKFVDLGRDIAKVNNVNWDIRIQDDGSILEVDAWDFTKMAGGAPPPRVVLRSLGPDPKTLVALEQLRLEKNTSTILSLGWQDLIKSAALEQIYVRRNTDAHVLNNIVRPLRVLASCTTHEPYELVLTDIENAVEAAKHNSPKLADSVLGVVTRIIDNNFISPFGPFSSQFDQTFKRNRTSAFAKKGTELKGTLAERKNAEKLPEKKVFWELCRIVFTEKPRSFLDMLKFSQLKIMLACGIRSGEAALLPLDWRREKSYISGSGKQAGEYGGYSSSLGLRYFGEKSQPLTADSRILFETVQPVPEMFRNLVNETLQEVEIKTRPLRETLKAQTESGRIFPFWEPSMLVNCVELYTHITGNPILINDMSEHEIEAYLDRYRENFSQTVLDEIREEQIRRSKSSKLKNAVYVFFLRLRETGFVFRTSGGRIYDAVQNRPHEMFLNIGELETYLSKDVSTKISDTTPFRTVEGSLYPFDLLYLAPKRALSEGRNGGLTDIGRYVSVGRFDGTTVSTSLGGLGSSSIFSVYGEGDEEKEYTMKSHSLRHLQNTELFRLGLADTIITKRFNRRSVTQSYEYDHRSLSEDLAQIEIPEDVESMLGDKPTIVAKLIISGRANGPIVDAFKTLQAQKGDAAAFDYLRVEADGFHSTPYGHCINSFTVDPCPKHLECFAGCKHLTATNTAENIFNLKTLQSRLSSAVQAAEARPVGMVGRDNQIEHAKIRLDGVNRLLATPEGNQVFPDGKDFSVNMNRRTPLDE